jgi:CBS domain-containing protein
VWAATGDLRHATYIASLGGQAVAYLLMAYGVMTFFMTGSLADGVWVILIGWFLLDAARAGYQQQVLQSALSGVRVRDIMTANVVTIPPELNLQQAVDEYFLRMNYAAFPVAEGSQLRGILTLPHVRQVPREQWASARAGDVVEPLDQSHLMRPDADAWDALIAMAGAERGRLLVVEGGDLVGIISRTDIMRFMRTKIELGM